MIYVTGDTHGMPVRLSLENMPYSRRWGKKDVLIVCGNFGYLMNGTTREELFLRELSFRAYTICFLDGNRDNHDMLNKYPVAEWQGGKVHRIRRNVIHLMRGQVYQMEGKQIFTMGGGYSIDRARRFEKVDWWPEELPNAQEYEEAWRNLEEAGNQVNYILTHSPPMSMAEKIMPPCDEERPLNEFLEQVKQRVEYQRWYFGHAHLDTPLEDNLYAVFTTVRELETGNILWD